MPSIFAKKQGTDFLYCPNVSTYVWLIHACAKSKDLDLGQRLHKEIFAANLLEASACLKSSLVNMYAQCNAVAKSQEVFDKFLTRDVVSWTALMTGYVDHGQCEKALDCFEHMQQEGFSPNTYTYLCSLKACSILQATCKARCLHGEIVAKGWEREELLGNMLVDLYSKSGNLASAQIVFDGLVKTDVISWTALVGGHAEHGHSWEALALLKKMISNGVVPNSYTCVGSLKACANTGAISEGQGIHVHACIMGFETQLLVGSALVHMYGKCGLLSEAQCIFDKILTRDEALWTALICAYVDQGYGKEALYYYNQMQHDTPNSNNIALICGLKACASIGAIDAGHELHMEITMKGLEHDCFICNSLVCMYASCGLLATAEGLLCKLCARDVGAWNNLLTCFIEYGCSEQVLTCFERMQVELMSMNAVSCVCALKACACLGEEAIGKEIHVKTVKFGFEGELILGSALVDMYMKCGLLAEALDVFNAIESCDVISWTVLITGYVFCGYADEALSIFDRMTCDFECGNAVTFLGSLRACSWTRDITRGRGLHLMILKKGLEEYPFVGNSLVDMYAKCGLLSEAQDVCLKLNVIDQVSRTAVIAGYVEHGCSEKAIDCLEQMQCERVLLNAITVSCGLKACGALGALTKGHQMHNELITKGFEDDSMIAFTLVDMYAKCALICEAQHIFDRVATTNGLPWNALIAGYAQMAEIKAVTLCLASMLQNGILPDSTTFVHIFNTCSDTGLLDTGQIFFHILSNQHICVVASDHFTCMADLFCRVGCIDRALATIEVMPFHPQAVSWHIVLGACLRNKDAELGQYAFKHTAILHHKDTVAHVLMSNLYTDSPNGKILGLSLGLV